ncbi:mitochondrial translation release factor 1 [Xylocopa sonorina]|uniref:mitochondrial translation release factor 1 n=1 Tax=Xylocopa sonorina TaxID=1818115 RepID=UPI00403B26A7
MFFIKGCTFSACRYYGSMMNKVQVFRLRCSLLSNLNNKTLFVSKLLSTDGYLTASDASVKKCLNHLMSAYQSEKKCGEGISEILKLHEIPLLLNEKIQIIENIQNLNDIVNGNEELKKLAQEEESVYKQQLGQIDEKILDIILKHLDKEYYENVILEVVPGVGGQEAMLFARDLLNMYISYCDYLGFNYELIEMIESEISGLRKAVLLISDSKAFGKLKYEGGVHRVQRNPITEKSGRMHTSTAVVTILPEPSNIDIELNEKDLKIESKKASGAGGQHVNTTNSAIRITHIPTGISVTSQSDRSQIKNKKLALMKLKSVLYQEQLDQQVSFSSKMRKKQMGTRLRNEKIRTYNFNQDRVTDHRITNGTMHNLKEFMTNGVDLEKLEDRLYKEMQQKILLDIIDEMESSN